MPGSLVAPTDAGRQATAGATPIEDRPVKEPLCDTDSRRRRFSVWQLAAGLQGQEGPYHAGPVIPIGGEGGWDYLSVDRAGAPPLRQPRDARRRHRHADQQGRRRHPRHAGRARLRDRRPDLGKGFSSNGRENNVSIVDLKTLKLIQKIDTGENPDAILYEPAKKEVYTMNGRGKSATVIDAATGKVVATIPLEGKPESAQADSKAGKIYVNMEDLNSGQGDRHRDPQGDARPGPARRARRRPAWRSTPPRTACSSAATTS